MNKSILIIFVLAIIMTSLVLAENLESNRPETPNLGDSRAVQAVEHIGSGQGARVRLDGEDVESELEVNETNDDNGNRSSVSLSNGRNAEVKVMPSTASETALARLRIRVCNETNNCTIQLKEVGSGNQTRATYEMQIERHSRILGIFSAKMRVRTHVDAENGNVTRVMKPWWAFLATEPAE